MRRLAVLVLLAASACSINHAVTPGFYVTKELATDCAKQCRTLDMRLAAVVIVNVTGGCVCEPKEATGSAAGRGGVAAAAEAIEQQAEAQAAAAKNGKTSGK